MKNISLKVQERTDNKTGRQLRAEGKIPAILYGKKIKNQALVFDRQKFEEVFEQAGTSSLLDLKIDSEKPVKVIIQDIQFDPVTDQIVHADFYQIKKDEKIKTEIPIEIIGQSPAVEEGGNLIIDKDQLEVECLPDKLVDHFKVDISALKTFDDVIRVKDLAIPKDIELLEEKEEVIATTTPPRTEEELEELEEAPTASDVDEVEVEAEKEAAEAGKEDSSDQPSTQLKEDEKTTPETESQPKEKE